MAQIDYQTRFIFFRLRWPIFRSWHQFPGVRTVLFHLFLLKCLVFNKWEEQLSASKRSKLWPWKSLYIQGQIQSHSEPSVAAEYATEHGFRIGSGGQKTTNHRVVFSHFRDAKVYYSTKCWIAILFQRQVLCWKAFYLFFPKKTLAGPKFPQSMFDGCWPLVYSVGWFAVPTLTVCSLRSTPAYLLPEINSNERK